MKNGSHNVQKKLIFDLSSGYKIKDIYYIYDNNVHVWYQENIKQSIKRTEAVLLLS